MKGRKVMNGLSFISPKYINEAEFVTVSGANAESKARHSKRPKIWLIAALIATMILLMGAAVYTRWSTSMQYQYNPSEEIKKQAEQSGLSVMLEETKSSENPDEVLSVTDQGITITAVQTIVDEYSAELTFRIEGFNLPDGRAPSVWPLITIDGDEDFSSVQGGAFFDGTTRNENFEWVYVSNGQPVEFGNDEYESAILDYSADDGSIEYTHYITFHEKDGRYLGKEIQVEFRYIAVQSADKFGEDENMVEGSWKLKWTLVGAENKIKTEPNTEIGDSGVVLLDAELGQRTIRTRYHVNDYWEGWNQLVELPQAIWGVRMKDGRELMCLSTTSGFEDQEKMIYFIDSTMFDSILDLSQVESLMFFKGRENDANGQPSIKTFYYIPISTN